MNLSDLTLQYGGALKMKKSRKSTPRAEKHLTASLFLLFLTPFICVAKPSASSARQPVKPTVQSRNNNKPHWKTGKAFKAQYESCQDVDISSAKTHKENKTIKTVAEFCFTCFFTRNYGFEEVKEAADTAQTKVFREKLQKRVIGQIESKVFQTEMLRACVTGNRNYFSQKKVDWPLMKEACKKHTKKLKSELKTLWPEMRINLALSQVNADQIVTGKPNLSFAPSHTVRDFSPMSKLTEKEQKEIKKRWAESFSEADVNKVTATDVKSKFLEGQPLKDLTAKDQSRLRKATWDMQKKAKDSYSEIMSETSMPLLMGYLKRDNPNKKELGEALLKVKENLKKLLEKAKDPEIDMGLFLSFKPLVEGLLKEKKEYCLAAEGARIKAENDGSIENWRMATGGIAAAAPCFIRGPWGAVACLIASVALGAEGYRQAQVATVESLGRALTEKEFETLTGVSEKEREEMLAKLGIPLAGFGTTAVPARAASRAIVKAFKKRLPSNKRNMEEVSEAMAILLNITRNLSKKELLAVDKVHRMTWEEPMSEFQHANKKRLILKKAGFSEEEIEKIQFWPPAQKVKNKVKLTIPTRSEDNIAQELKVQGFGPGYTRGIDELNDTIAVRKELERLNVDPYTTHIDFFANKMREHITHIEKGSKTPQQRKAVNRLKKYMNKLIKDESVTYDRWIKFNFMASNALSEKGFEVPSAFGLNIVRIINKFPEEIIMPTLKGQVGIMTLNRGRAEGIIPAGLTTETKIVDGVEMNPLEFLAHDVFDHGMMAPVPSKEIHNKLMEKVKSLPKQKRKNVEVAYFLLVHEQMDDIRSLNDISPASLRWMLRNEKNEPHILGNLLDISTDEKAERVVDDLMDVVSQIQAEKEALESGLKP